MEVGRICYKMNLFLLLNAACALTVYGLNNARLYDACRPEDGLIRHNGHCKGRYSLYSEKAERLMNCNGDEFQCRPVYKCIPRAFLNTRGGCNFISNKEKIVLPCRSDEFLCQRSGICIKRWSVRNQIPDCNSKEFDDLSDETTAAYATCLHNEFRCLENGRCIPREWVMDNVPDCQQGSDENEPLRTCDEADEFQCPRSKRCIKRYRVADGFTDCARPGNEDDSDEIGPLPACHNTTEFRCTDSGRCIPRSWLNDGTENCKNGADERLPRYYACNEGEFQCHNGFRCIPSKYLCDGMDHCGDCSDEIESCLEPRMWRCGGGHNGTCIPQSYACDVFQDCPDGSDNPNWIPGFKCTATIAGVTTSCPIPQWSLSDSHAICENKDDICYLNDTFQCDYCGDGTTVISKAQVCDEILDCTDLWDECICFNNRSARGNIKKVCDNVCYGNDSPACDACSLGQLYCPIEGKCLNGTQLCDGSPDCEVSELDEKACVPEVTSNSSIVGDASPDFLCWDFPSEVLDFLHTSKVLGFVEKFFVPTATRCDGVVECARFEDECSAGCDNEPKECKHFPLVNYTTTYIRDVVFLLRVCSDYDPKDDFDFLDFVAGRSICNGVKECKDGADETACPGRHYCDAGTVRWALSVKDVVSIDEKTKKCNFQKDCLDFSDERNCSKESHFYCKSGDPLFVATKTSVMNGIQECSDNSDECPPSAFDNNPFSSRFEMIKNKFLRYFLWIMATFAIFGNIGVILETYFLELRSSQVYQGMTLSRCNKLLIINLAVGDLLMGVTLLAIGSHSMAMSGNYCSEEKEWRISGGCNAIGCLAVISSETSVFTLVVLTSYRLYSVYRPFTSRNVKRNKLICAVIAIWSLAILLSIVPLIPVLNESMLTKALTSPSVYFNSTTVAWHDFQTFAVRAAGLSHSAYTPGGFSSWDSIVDLLQHLKLQNLPEIKGYFGYYSTHGVCMPKFFKTDSTPLHPLSLFVITINFLCLVFIITSYCLIYHKSRATGKKVGGKSSSNTADTRSKAVQRKITILVATDLCCWLPICVMTYVSLGGHPIPEMVYAVSAIILLPINSSLNPLIYSDGLKLSRDLFMKKVRGRLAVARPAVGDNSSSETSRTRKTDVGMETLPRT